MKKWLIVALLAAMGGGCYATVRRPTIEVWCYDPIWKQGHIIGTQLAVCETRDGEAVQVVIAPIARTRE